MKSDSGVHWQYVILEASAQALMIDICIELGEM